MLLLTRVLPGLQQIVRHRIVVDGDKQIGMHGIGARRPLEQAAPRRRRGDQERSLAETGVDERLLDLLGKLKIEGVFRNSPRAHGAGHIDGMADVDRDAEFRPLAVVRLGRDRGRLLASRRRRGGEQEGRCKQGAERQSGVP